MKRIFIVLLCLGAASVFAQELPITKTTSSSQMRHIWNASWITHPTASVFDFGVFHVRRSFNVDEKPDEFIVHVSADNRYRLFVNGNPVGEGPARDDLHHWPYDTFDIAQYLIAGENVLAAQIINYGEYKSGGQFSDQTAFILSCPEMDEIDTDALWKILQNHGLRANPITPDSFAEYYQVLGFYAGGPCDSLIAADYPWGWETKEYDDSDWQPARVIRKGAGRGFAYGNTWFLVPRQIDYMIEEEQKITTIERASIKISNDFLEGTKEVIIPANTTVTILCDQEKETMGYPQLTFSGGKSGTIKITYAESLYDNKFLKGDRNAVKDKNIYGIFDIIKPDGGANRLFRPSWVRAFRYLQLDITTKEQPLTLHKLENRFTSYPLTEKACVKTNDESLSKIWDASWNALKLCARETYFSDAYFEQMQYIGDTRVQALASMAVSGDVSLFKNALKQFDESRVPNGLTQSRYPARELQIIPTYSLLYIAMIHDYMMVQDDPDFIKSLTPGIHSILAWFNNHVDDTGLLTGLDWWNFCDWSFSVGIPPGADGGYSTLIALQYVYAMQKAADIFEYLGDNDSQKKYMEIAASVQNSVKAHCYNADKQLYAETPDKKQYSQHTNIFAVLTNTHPQDQQTELMTKVISDKTLIQTTFYFKFYLFSALQQCGMGNEFMQQLDPWRKFIDLGLTTFPEDDSDSPRSDCHPWSSSPVYYMLTFTAGIHSTAPGFKELVIAPHLGDLKELDAAYPHPLGEIKIALKRSGKAGLNGDIKIPQGLSQAVFEWNGQKVKLEPGIQTIHL